MNITTNVASLNWRSNTKGTWKALVKDLSPDTEVTFSDAFTGVVTGKQITVESPTMPTGFITYTTDDTNVVAGGALYGAGTAYDSVEAVTGEKTVKIGSYTFTGEETWTLGVNSGVSYNSYFTSVTGKKTGLSNLLITGFVTSSASSWTGLVDKTCIGANANASVYVKNDEWMTPEQVAAGMAGKTIYYELATPTTSTETPQSMTITSGDNTFGGGSFDATYEGTDYSIPLGKNCKYIHRFPDGTEELLTGSTTVTSVNVTGAQDKLINLTHWFGKGKEPSINDFYRLYPTWKFYDIPYDSGKILNYKGTGIQTIGFNAYDHSTGTAVLLGGNRYQICGTYTSCSYVDQWGNTETLEIDANGIFTPVNNGTLTVVGGNNTDTCVHLVWSGYKNFGEPEYKYEEYTKVDKSFPISTYFPEGMNGFGNVFDELTSDGYVKSYAVKVFTGTETFDSYASGSGFVTNISDMKKGSASDGVKGACNYFTVWNGSASQTSGSFVMLGLNNTNAYFMNAVVTGVIDTPSDWKGYLKDLYDAGTPLIIVYPLATPITTSIPEPLNLSYPVNDFGTEQSLPINTTTLLSTDLNADIKYSQDFTRLLVHYSDMYPTVKTLVEDEPNLMRKDDVAPNATVGNAYNLIDRNAAGTERQFSFDTAGGTQDIADGTAVSKKLMGTTLNLNQLVHDTNENTVNSVEGNATVTDAVEGNVKHLVVSGDTVVVNQLVKENVEKTETGVDRIWIKDAAEGAAKGLKVTAPVSTVENQAVQGVTPAFTLNGDNTSFATAPQEMFGINDVRDEWDVVVGAFIASIGSIDLSTLTWTESSGVWTATISDIKSNTVNVLSASYSGISVNGTDVSITSTVSPTGLLYYELATPVITDVTPVTFNLVSHDNTIFQTSGDLKSTIQATYDGLNQTITLDPTHTYIVNHQYISDSIITNESSIDVIGTEDNLVDLTQLYNGDSTRISAIHSWASLSSKIHMYRDWLPYIPGEIVNLAATIRVYRHEYAYGVLYDPSQSSPVCHKVELHDGVLTQVNEFSSLPVHDKFYRCVMDDLSTRHIAYYLDDTDSTKKYNGTRNGITSDGSASVLTGADGDVMVEMPITHWSIDEDYNGEGKILWLISDQPFTGSEIHPYFYVSSNGDTARTQYVGAYRAVGCDENGNALNTTEGVITQTAGTASTRLLRSVAGALPWVSNTLASMRTDAVRHGGTMVNRLFHEYLFLMIIIEQASLNCQSVSLGYSNGKTNALWAWRKSGRANYGNGTGEILATSGTTDDDNFYSLKVNNVQLYRDVARDANNYYAWSNHASTATVYWTASATPANGDTAYSDTEGTSSGYTVASWSTTTDANKIIQFQYRGIENPWGEVLEFDDGVQKYQKCMLTVIRINNILHYVNHLKDGTGTKTAWTSEDGTSTYWTTIAAPGNNSIAYSDSACTIDSGYKTTQVTFINVDCEMWESLSVNDYTSTDQHTTVTKLYNKRRYYWPRGSWIKKFDPRSFLPRTIGGNGSTYLCDNWYNDNGTGSRVVFRGGSVRNGTGDGLGFVDVGGGLTASNVGISGRLSA